MSENRGQMSENRGQMSENRVQMTDYRIWNSAGGKAQSTLYPLTSTLSLAFTPYSLSTRSDFRNLKSVFCHERCRILCTMPFALCPCCAQLATPNLLSENRSQMTEELGRKWEFGSRKTSINPLRLTLYPLTSTLCFTPYALRLEPYALLKSSVHDFQSQIPYPKSQIEKPATRNP